MIEGKKWWINVRSGDVVTLPYDVPHGEAVARDPGVFGIPDPEMADLKAHHPDRDHDSWWEWARHAAQTRGWVRIGVGQDPEHPSRPYLYAATVGDARGAVRWMRSTGLLGDEVEVEISSPNCPNDGEEGDFEILADRRAVETFLRTGAPFDA